ncbi:hypothetical protein LEMLEM_LOCUS18830 [Lemmus lemmus]
MPLRTVGTACAWRGVFLFRYLSQRLQELHPPSFPGRKPSSASFVPDVVSAVFRESRNVQPRRFPLSLQTCYYLPGIFL